MEKGTRYECKSSLLDEPGRRRELRSFQRLPKFSSQRNYSTAIFRKLRWKVCLGKPLHSWESEAVSSGYSKLFIFLPVIKMGTGIFSPYLGGGGGFKDNHVSHIWVGGKAGD